MTIEREGTAELQKDVELAVLNIDGDNPIHHAMRNGQLEIANQLTQHLFIQLGFAQRLELPALQRAFATLYAYHHPSTIQNFFASAQEEYEANERQQQLADLWDVEESGEEIKEEEAKQITAKRARASMQPIGSLSDKEFEQHQLGQAREQFFQLLKNLHPTDPLVSLILLGLSESYLQQRAYEDAMNYATNAVHHHRLTHEAFSQNSPAAVVLYQTLLASQQQRIIIFYCQQVLGQKNDPGHLKWWETYRLNLEQHREWLKEKVTEDILSQAIRAVVKKNTDFFSDLTQDLWLQVRRLSQRDSPCHYVLLSLGSMSQEEMCPYSDLKFALLLEKDTPEIRLFFQSLIRLMHLLVIGLGETPMDDAIPCQIPFSATVTGYRFARGCHTPLYDDLMGTPDSLAAIQQNESPDLTITRHALRATGFVTGNEAKGKEYLHKNYQKLLERQLTPHTFGFPSHKKRKAQALEILRGALLDFSPSNLNDARHNKEMDELNIEADLYRLPTQVIDGLSLYYEISGKTTFEKLENLAKGKRIDGKTARQLTQVLETALKFRVVTQLHYGTEKESVAYQSHEREERLPNERPVYVLSSTEQKELFNAYQILLLLENVVRDLVFPTGKNDPFKQPLLLAQAEFNQPSTAHHREARSYERLYPPKKALESYRRALKSDWGNVDIHLDYVSYLHSLCEMHQRNQTAYEVMVVSYTKKLVTQLLTLPPQRLLAPNGFDFYYQALPLAWRPAVFSAILDDNNPLHRCLLEHVDRIDNLSKEEGARTHANASVYIATQAKSLLVSQVEEAKDASALESETAEVTVEWARVSGALKKQTHSAEEQSILLTYNLCLLSELVKSEVVKVKEYAKEFEEILANVTHLLLKPDNSGARDSGPLLTFYRRLPYNTRSAFRRTILARQESMTQQHAQPSLQRHQADLDVFTALLKTLNEEPDEIGQRESWQQHKRVWQDTLQSLVEAESAEKVRVKSAGKNEIFLVSPLLDKEGKEAVSRPLKSSVRDALLDETFEFKHNIINGSEHRVICLSVKRTNGTTVGELYCKAYPEMPGMTYLIERLHHRLIGHGTCLSELIKIERPSKPPIPVLLSEKIAGPTLHKVLKDHPQRLQQLDHQRYSDLVLLAILTNPEDGLPTNYIVTPKTPGSSALTLVSIDHDHALFPPYLQEPEGRQKNLSSKLQVKTILFCLDAMKKPIDSASRDALLRLNPAKVIASVLREAQVQNDYYNRLFDPEVIKAFHQNRSTKPNLSSRAVKGREENCTIPIPLKEGDAVNIYQKLCRLQQLLTDHPQATLLQCLLHTEPRVGMAYSRALSDYSAPLDRLFHLGKYPLNPQGQMVTNTRAIKSIRLTTQQIGAEHYADLKDLTPAQGLAELDFMAYQQGTLDSIREEVMQGNLNRFLVLKASEHKAAVISGTGGQRKGINWDRLDATIQRALLKALQGIAFTHLNLKGCQALTKTELLQLLVQSPDCTVLNLSGHPSLNDGWLKDIVLYAPRLKELIIRQALCLKIIDSIALFDHLKNLDIADNPALEIVNIRAPKLKLLQAKNCPQLHTLQTASQQLREVDVSGNQALQLTKKLAHKNSIYVLNRLKLSGCAQVKTSTARILSGCPMFLWGQTSLTEEAQIKVVTLLEQYIGQEGWQSLSIEQKKQISARFILYEYEQTSQQVEGLKLLLEKAKGRKSSIPELPQPTLAEVGFQAPDSQSQPVNVVLVEVKDEDLHAQSPQPTLAEVVSHVPAPQLQIRIEDVLAGVQDGDENLRKSTQQTLATLSPCALAFQSEKIVDAALRGTKDQDKQVRQAAQQALAVLVPHASASQLPRIVHAILAGAEDDDLIAVVQKTLPAVRALAPGADIFQLEEIIYAALEGMQDNNKHVQQTARRILADLVALAPHLAPPKLKVIVDTMLAQGAGLVKGNGEKWLVRQAVHQTLTALVPHLSNSEQLQKMVRRSLRGMQDKEQQVQQAAQQTFAKLASRVCSQLEGTVDQFFAWMKGEDIYVQLAAYQALATVVPHVSSHQLQRIINEVLTWVENKDGDVRQAIYQTLAVLVPCHAKGVTLDQLSMYCQWIQSCMQCGDENIQLIMLSGVAVVQRSIGLEPYLSTLQAERQEILAPSWLTQDSIYEQVETQIIELHVPDIMQGRVKAYESATQTALQILETRKSVMEALVPPELKANQEQFMEDQAALFEQYHQTEQQRIIAFQESISQSEASTQEALTAERTRFEQEQVEAEEGFQNEIKAFCQKNSTQLKEETKLDVSDLLQERRAFLDEQLKQRKIQTQEQQTVLIGLHDFFQAQARELEELQESKADMSAGPAPQKALSQIADPVVQQMIQELQAQMQVLQKESAVDKQELELYRHRLKILLKERQEAQQLIQAVDAIKVQPALFNFYECIKVELGECFVACKLIASGAIDPSLSTKVTLATQGISCVGNLVPIPYVALIGAGISGGIQYLAKRDSSQRSKRASNLLGSLVEMDQLAERIARLLTWRYEIQIQQLMPESAILLAKVAVACMMEGLRSKGAIDPEKSLTQQMVQAIYKNHRLIKWPQSLQKLFQTTLTTRSGQTDWIALSVLLECGIAVRNKKDQTFNFYGSPNLKYGYRLGSMEEVAERNLIERVNVSDNIKLAFRHSIGLRFMDAFRQKRAGRVETLVLPPSFRPAAASFFQAPEEKKREVPRFLIPRHLPDVSANSEDDGGPPPPYAPPITKEQIQFEEGEHITFSRSRSLQQEESSSACRSSLHTSQ